MREIALDTETTGLDADGGDRIAEIACIEMIDHQATEVRFHKHVNPERSMPEEARRIHGLSDEFLADKPRFAEIADEFLAFIGDCPLVAHNASFDMRFINMELARCGKPEIPADRAIDTLAIAQRKFPGARASLDALCQRFAIDNSSRTLHGALLDTQLLAEVYLELCGGREPGLALATAAEQAEAEGAAVLNRTFRPARPHAPTAEETAAWEAFVATLTDPLWTRG